ncbi:MAG: hypothetical protein ABSB15_21970 [Bryobacteraceae bacterium]
MSDLTPWLEMELTRQLSPVVAPASLWNSIQTQRTERRVEAGGWVLWPAVAVMLFLACGALFWNMRDITQLTGRELRSLADSSLACDFWSDDPAEIRNWVKSKGNIDVDIPVAHSGAARLMGARLVRVRGTLVAAIAYRMSNGAATLLVAKPRAGSQLYEVAFSGGDPQGACLVCHL